MTVIEAYQSIGAVFWFNVRVARGDDHYISGGGLDSVRRFGVRVLSPQHSLCAFSSCPEYFLYRSSGVLGCQKCGSSVVYLLGVSRMLGTESGEGASGELMQSELVLLMGPARVALTSSLSPSRLPSSFLHVSLPFITVSLPCARHCMVVELRV